LAREAFDALFAALARRGFTVIGPTVRDGVITYDEVSAAADLPAGWTDEQDAGHYRLRRRDDQALFGHVVGPRSWKSFLQPPRVRLATADRSPDGALAFADGDTDPVPPRAFLGMRSCELHALAIHDRVFLRPGTEDAPYARRRQTLFTVAVNCGQAGGTCFCVSMDTGPAVDGSRVRFDLLLTELLDGPDGHRFLVVPGSPAGAEVAAELPLRPAAATDLAAARDATEHAARHMGRSLDTRDLPARLLADLDHPHWQSVADRCLTCANCTLVCPTCFCTTVEDVTDLTGGHAERWRRWDSCFTLDFSWMHGGPARQSAKSRYRQWLTHKLATWHDQFGTSGCVGCGRCVTWCPVGIDLTAEAAALTSPEP
jgi:ferredoxin